MHPSVHQYWNLSNHLLIHRLLVHSSLQAFIHSFSIAHSFIHSFVCSVIDSLNYRPFASWRHFTTRTRILQGFAFLCKLGLLLFKPRWDYQICETQIRYLEESLTQVWVTNPSLVRLLLLTFLFYQIKPVEFPPWRVRREPGGQLSEPDPGHL